MKIETLATLIFAAVVLCRVLLWLMQAERTPDPWGPEVEAALESRDAVPLCPHCLAPQEHLGWFWPECGSTIGQYCNYLPAVWIFSVGEAFRRGVTERFRWSPLIVIGYILVLFSYFSLLALVLLIFLLKNLGRNVNTPTGSNESEA